MFGESDARREDLGSGEPSGVQESGEEHPRVGAGLDPSPEVPTPPVTGDQAVDEAMARLAESQPGSFAERIEAGEDAHRSLQSRLGGLGGA